MVKDELFLALWLGDTKWIDSNTNKPLRHREPCSVDWIVKLVLESFCDEEDGISLIISEENWNYTLSTTKMRY